MIPLSYGNKNPWREESSCCINKSLKKRKKKQNAWFLVWEVLRDGKRWSAIVKTWELGCKSKDIQIWMLSMRRETWFLILWIGGGGLRCTDLDVKERIYTYGCRERNRQVNICGRLLRVINISQEVKKWRFSVGTWEMWPCPLRQLRLIESCYSCASMWWWKLLSKYVKLTGFLF